MTEPLRGPRFSPLQTLSFMKSPAVFFRENSQRYGDPFIAKLRKTQAISLEIIIRAVFGVEEPERVRRFMEAVTVYADSYTPLLMLVVPLRRSFGGLGPWARFERNSQALDALLTEQIARRRADGRGGEDILTLMLSARDEDCRRCVTRRCGCSRWWGSSRESSRRRSRCGGTCCRWAWG